MLRDQLTRADAKYDALRQVEQKAQAVLESGSAAKATAEMDSSQKQPTRPIGHPASPPNGRTGVKCFCGQIGRLPKPRKNARIPHKRRRSIGTRGDNIILVMRLG